MGRTEGFDVMDVSTALLNDPKVKRLAREHPEQLTTGFMAYVATMADSWRHGERVTVDDAWPTYLAFDEPAVAALKAVQLLDARGRVTTSGWRGYFESARDRREKTRERWRRWNEAKAKKEPASNGATNADTALGKRGANVGQTPPSVRPSVLRKRTNESLSEENPSARGAGANGKGERDDVAALLERWPKVSKGQRRTLDEVLSRHDVTGAAFAAQVIRATPADKDPLAAVLEADRLWQDAQRRRAEAEEQAWADEKAAERADAERVTSDPSWLAGAKT
jgi:hypothetical protein